MPVYVRQTTISLQQQLAGAEREVVYRQKVYARLVATKRMNQGKADYEIDVMRAIVVTLRAALEHERHEKQLVLFGGEQ